MTNIAPTDDLTKLTRLVEEYIEETNAKKDSIDRTLEHLDGVIEHVDATEAEIDKLYGDMSKFDVDHLLGMIDRLDEIDDPASEYVFYAREGQTEFVPNAPVLSEPLVFVNGTVVEGVKVTGDGTKIILSSPAKEFDVIKVRAQGIIGDQLAAATEILAARDDAVAAAYVSETATSLDQLSFTTVAGQDTYQTSDQGVKFNLVAGAWVEGPDGVSLINGTDYEITSTGFVKLKTSPVAGRKYIVKHVPHFKNELATTATVTALNRVEAAAAKVDTDLAKTDQAATSAKADADRVAAAMEVAAVADYARVDAGVARANDAKTTAANASVAATASKNSAASSKTTATTARNNLLVAVEEAAENKPKESPPLIGEILHSPDSFPLPRDMFDTGVRLAVGSSELAITSYNTSLMAYFPAVNVVFWSGSLNPDNGRIFSDAAGETPTQSTGSPTVRRIGKLAGSVDATMSSGAVPLARMPYKGTPERRNLLPDMEASPASWTGNATTTVEVGVKSPVPFSPVYRISGAVSSTAIGHNTSSASAVVGAPMVWSIYARSADLALRLQIGTENSVVNLQSGTVISNTASVPATVVDAGGGWWHITQTVASAASTVSGLSLFTPEGSLTWISDGSKHVQIAGSQLERGTEPTTFQRAYSNTNVSENPGNDVWYLDTTSSPFAINLPAGPVEIANVSNEGEIIYTKVEGGGASQGIAAKKNVADMFVYRGEMTERQKMRLEQYWTVRYGFYVPPPPTVITLGMSPTSGRVWLQPTSSNSAPAFGGNAALLLIPNIDKPEYEISPSYNFPGATGPDEEGFYTRTTTGSATGAVSHSGFEAGDLVKVVIEIKERLGGVLAINHYSNTTTPAAAVSNISAVGTHTYHIPTAKNQVWVGIPADFRGKFKVSFVHRGKGAWQSNTTNTYRPYYAVAPRTGIKNELNGNTSSPRTSGSSSVSGTIAGETDMWLMSSGSSGNRLLCSGSSPALTQNTDVVCRMEIRTTTAVTAVGLTVCLINSSNVNEITYVPYTIPVAGEAPVLGTPVASSSALFTNLSARTYRMREGVWAIELSCRYIGTATKYLTVGIYSTASPSKRVEGGRFYLAKGTEITGNYQRVVSNYNITEEGVPNVYAIYKLQSTSALPIYLPAGNHEFALVMDDRKVTYRKVVSDGTNPIELLNILLMRIYDIVYKAGEFTPEEREIINRTWAEAYGI